MYSPVYMVRRTLLRRLPSSPKMYRLDKAHQYCQCRSGLGDEPQTNNSSPSHTNPQEFPLPPRDSTGQESNDDKLQDQSHLKMTRLGKGVALIRLQHRSVQEDIYRQLTG